MFQNRLGYLRHLIVERKFVSVICRKFLLKLALRTKAFLKRSHASTLSIRTEEIKAKSEEEPLKQQLTLTLSDYKHLAHFFGKYKN